MAKDKPKNGRRTIKSTRARPPGPQHKPTGKKDPGGFKSPGFKSEGFTSGGRKVKTGPPPSVRARDEKRAGQPPPVKYAGKKKPPKIGWGGGIPEKPPWMEKPPRPRPKPKPKPKPSPGRPPRPKPKPGPRPRPGPRPGRPRPKKPMGKGRAK